MLKFILIFCFFIGVNRTLCSQEEYYPIDGYGKLTLFDNGRFYYDFFDANQKDTGSYIVKYDTLYLTSGYPNNIIIIPSDKPLDTLNCMGWKFLGKREDADNKFLEEVVFSWDTVVKAFVVNNCTFKKGDIISAGYYLINKYMWETDTIKYCYIKDCAPFSGGGALFLNNYPLLMRNKSLKPFNSIENEKYELINRYKPVKMKKKNKLHKYKVRESGYIITHSSQSSK